MARGTTLGELVTKLRTSARYDPNPALSKNMVPLFTQTIQDTQERLYDEYDWPFLKIQRDKVLQAGDRYYDVPDDLNLERITSVDVQVGGVWQAVQRGICLDDYTAINSDAGARSDPVMRWDVIDTGNGEQIEVWPVPASNGGLLRFSGIRKLAQLVDTANCADIDDQLIVLFAAAELLASKNAADQAKLKLQQANARLALLRGRVAKRTRGSFKLGGDPDNCGERNGFPRGAVVVAIQPTS